MTLTCTNTCVGSIPPSTTDAVAQQELEPTRCPSSKPQNCIVWQAMVWRRPGLHRQAVSGFWSTGLANSLNGSEDHLIAREAKTFWDALSMSALREAAVADVATCLAL